MAYTNTLAHITFDSNQFINEVNGSGPHWINGVPTIVPGKFENAWEMAPNVEVRFAISNLTTAFSAGCWLNSTNPGLATSSSGVTIPICLPLFSKCTFVNGLYGARDSSYVNFLVYEETEEDNKNHLAIELGSSKSITGSYTAGEWHHLWIAYSGDNPKTLKVWIDLEETAVTTIKGTLPTSLTSNSSDLTINGEAPGYSYNRIRNSAIIDDFLLLTVYIDDTSKISKAANNGSIYIANSDLSKIEEISQAIVFDDPSTVQITSVFANRGNVYVGRSDGQLLKGVRSIWRSRRDFNNPQEIDLVTVQYKGTTSPEISKGAIKLTNETIRI